MGNALIGFQNRAELHTIQKKEVISYPCQIGEDLIRFLKAGENFHVAYCLIVFKISRGVVKKKNIWRRSYQNKKGNIKRHG